MYLLNMLKSNSTPDFNFQRNITGLGTNLTDISIDCSRHYFKKNKSSPNLNKMLHTNYTRWLIMCIKYKKLKNNYAKMSHLS